MDHGVAAAQCVVDVISVGHVSLDNLDEAGTAEWLKGAVHTVRRPRGGAHIVPRVEQCADRVRADESTGSGDEH